MRISYNKDRLNEMNRHASLDELINRLEEKVNTDRETIKIKLSQICYAKLTMNQAMIFADYYISHMTKSEIRYHQGKDSVAHVERSLESAEKKITNTLIDIYGGK